MHAAKAAAGDAAQAGEQAQLDKMIGTDDFLLLGRDWEAKRRNRFKKERNDDGTEGPGFEGSYGKRWAVSGRDLTVVCREVLDRLRALERTTIGELERHATNASADAYATLDAVRKKKITEMQAAFRSCVLEGNVTVA